MKRYYIIVIGRVQGVGFRYTMQINAMNLGLSGWVRNLDNGNVEMEVEGEESSLNKFVSLMTQGNQFISVEDYSIKEIPLKHETKFRVTY